MTETTTEKIIELIDDAVSCIEAAKKVFLFGALRGATTSEMSEMVSDMSEMVANLENFSVELERNSVKSCLVDQREKLDCSHNKKNDSQILSPENPRI